MDSVSQNSTSTESGKTATHPSMEGRIFVLISIAIVAVMFVGMVGLLFWRERPAPSGLLVLRVPASLDGATATIDTKYGRDLSPVVTTLHGDQEVRVPLPPGEYIVKIEFANNSRRPIRADCVLSDYSYFPIVLEDRPATQPTMQGKTKS
jgi:hypothetical protein